MLEQVAEVLPEVKDRVISLLLMVLFLLLGVAWGVALTAELKCGSSALTRGLYLSTQLRPCLKQKDDKDDSTSRSNPCSLSGRVVRKTKPS
jgi:hypothetical protein